jgi:hypothetical protein
MKAALVTLALAAIPMSIGMGFVVEAMFPFMSSNTAGLVAGAVTFPALALIMAAGRYG